MAHSLARNLCLALLAVLLAACNLNNEAPGAPTLPPTTIASPQPPTEPPTPLQGLPTPLPGGLPTRTPFGFSGGAPTSLPLAVPTSATGEAAEISSPANGSVVTIGTLSASGLVRNLPQDQFTLQLLDAAGNVLNSQLITLRNPNRVAEVPWSAAMTTGSYTGPAEIRVLAQDATGAQILLARTGITLSDGGAVIGPVPGQAANGPTGRIDGPLNNSLISGDTILVSGTAGGIFENSFVVALIAANGTVLNTQIVTLTSPDFSTMVPWSVALGTGGYRGPAEIRAFASSPRDGSEISLGSVRVTIQ